MRLPVAVEDLGYGALWFPEGPFTKESFAHAATLLGVTERLLVATGVANLWMREPAAMAAGAATLNDAYNNRFLRGIGASHAPFIEQLGRRPTGPVTTMRSYLDRMDEAHWAQRSRTL